jgi:hypothetical protein
MCASFIWRRTQTNPSSQSASKYIPMQSVPSSLILALLSNTLIFQPISPLFRGSVSLMEPTTRAVPLSITARMNLNNKCLHLAQVHHQSAGGHPVVVENTLEHRHKQINFPK